MVSQNFKHIAQIVLRCTGDVWGEQQVFGFPKGMMLGQGLIFEYIKSSTFNSLVCEGTKQGSLISKPSPCHINEHAFRLHPPETVFTKKTFGFRGKRKAEHNIAEAMQLSCQVLGQDEVVCFGAVSEVADTACHPHLKGPAALCHRTSDFPHPDHTHPLSPDFLMPIAFPYPLPLLIAVQMQVFGEGEDAAGNMLGNTHRINPRRRSNAHPAEIRLLRQLRKAVRTRTCKMQMRRLLNPGKHLRKERQKRSNNQLKTSPGRNILRTACKMRLKLRQIRPKQPLQLRQLIF